MSYGLRLATCLSIMASLQACEPLENVIRAANPDDPVAKMHDAAYLTITPSTPDPIVEPETVYVPPEPPPLGCEPHRNWRYMIFDCQDRQIGTYE